VREVTGTGVVEAVQERSLAFAAGGTVATVAVAEGDAVAAGQSWRGSTPRRSSVRRHALRTSLASARADRDRLDRAAGVDRLDAQAAVAHAEDQRVRAGRAQRRGRRARPRRRSGSSPPAPPRATRCAPPRRRSRPPARSLAQADLALQTARSRLANLDQLAAAQRASAAAQVTQLETNLANLEARLADTTIVAPFAGVVTGVSSRAATWSARSPCDAGRHRRCCGCEARFDENRAAELVVGQGGDRARRRHPPRLAATVERISPVRCARAAPRR
jgi:multidrug resistance efflux pump